MDGPVSIVRALCARPCVVSSQLVIVPTTVSVILVMWIMLDRVSLLVSDATQHVKTVVFVHTTMIVIVSETTKDHSVSSSPVQVIAVDTVRVIRLLESVIVTRGGDLTSTALLSSVIWSVESTESVPTIYSLVFPANATLATTERRATPGCATNSLKPTRLCAAVIRALPPRHALARLIGQETTARFPCARSDAAVTTESAHLPEPVRVMVNILVLCVTSRRATFPVRMAGRALK